jgi:hypothetical protein
MGDHLTLERAGTAWESREAKIPKGFLPSVIAIDGPLLPQGTAHDIRRHVEFIFSRAPFHNRCRPGLSHSGVGFQFRRASEDACISLVPNSPFRVEKWRRRLPRRTRRRSLPKCLSGRADARSRIAGCTEVQAGTALRLALRTDGYNREAGVGAAKTLDLPDVVWHRLRSETDHELRAALICLLTAALASKGTTAIIGEAEGGRF